MSENVNGGESTPKKVKAEKIKVGAACNILKITGYYRIWAEKKFKGIKMTESEWKFQMKKDGLSL